MDRGRVEDSHDGLMDRFGTEFGTEFATEFGIGFENEFGFGWAIDIL